MFDKTGGGKRLVAELKRIDCRLGVEIITSGDGVANKGDFCKHCIIDAIYQLDDRPRAA